MRLVLKPPCLILAYRNRRYQIEHCSLVNNTYIYKSISMQFKASDEAWAQLDKFMSISAKKLAKSVAGARTNETYGIPPDLILQQESL